MKKSLLAVAALGAFASAAQAQSSVTVYGILDVGYVGYNTRAATGAVNGATSVGVTKTTGNTFGQGAESTNRLGFKGVEDLGGGTSAFFTIELGLNPQSQSEFSTATTNSTQNRQTFAGLKKNGLGDFAVGTQYTVIHNAVSVTDPGNANNMMGNLIYTANPTGATDVKNGNSNGDSYTIRTNNALTLNSDSFAGFKAHAILVMNNQNSTQVTNPLTNNANTTTITGGTNNQNGWGLGLDYSWNKLFVTANVQQLKAQNPITYTQTTTSGPTISTISAGTPVYFGAGQSSQLGTNVQDNQYYVAATYDFGILKAYAQYIDRKISLQQNSNYYLKRNAEQIGVRSYITPTIEAWASGAMGKYTAYGYSNPAANLTAWQIGSNYWLSKRTNLYAIYGQANTSNVSVVNNANPASANANSYAIGVRHTF
jgi:predicted porin